MLKKTHRERRLEFEKYHKNWTVEDFKRVLWSDETEINQIGSDGKTYIRGEQLSDWTITPTVKHGGGNNLMVWGCMGWNGVRKLIEVEGRMDTEQYCEILENGLVESFETLEMEEGSDIFNRTMIQNIPARRPKSGLKTMIFKSYLGQPNSLN